MSPSLDTLGAIQPLGLSEIERRLSACPCLPALASINKRLRQLLEADNLYTFQIAEVIRHDPGLTESILHVVNSVFYGLRQRIRSIDDAVSYLGMQQIRQLVVIAPIMEEFQKLVGNHDYPWRRFWQHSLAVALITHELLGSADIREDDLGYLAGLLHDIGKIVAASVFPAHFRAIRHRLANASGSPLTVELEVLGLDHGRLGALYLRNHRLVGEIVATAEFHHYPDRAPYQSRIIGAVQIANLLANHRGITANLNPVALSANEWQNAASWALLYSPGQAAEKTAAQEAIAASSNNLPTFLQQFD